MDKTIAEFLTTVTMGELLGAMTVLAAAYVAVLVLSWWMSD